MRHAVRTGLARIEEIAKQIEAGTVSIETEGRALIALIDQVCEQATKDELVAMGLDRQTLKDIARAESIVYGKRFADLYDIKKRLEDRLWARGLTAALPPAPVAKQAPTAQELITAKVQQAAAALVAAGKAVDELAALSKIDPALADGYRRTNAAPTGVTILPQYQPAQTPGTKPTPQSESDRGLVGA